MIQQEGLVKVARVNGVEVNLIHTGETTLSVDERVNTYDVVLKGYNRREDADRQSVVPHVSNVKDEHPNVEAVVADIFRTVRNYRDNPEEFDETPKAVEAVRTVGIVLGYIEDYIEEAERKNACHT